MTLDHMITLDDAQRFAERKGCTARPSASGASLDFFNAAGKLIGSTVIGANVDGVPTVSRHGVKLALNDQ